MMAAAPPYTYEKNILKFYIRLLLYLEDEYIKDAGFRHDTGDDNYLTFVGNALDKTFVELLGSEINKEGTPYNIDYNTVETDKLPQPPPPPPSPPQPRPPQPPPAKANQVDDILQKIAEDPALKEIKGKLKYKSRFFGEKFLSSAMLQYEASGLDSLNADFLERTFYETKYIYENLPTPFALYNKDWQNNSTFTPEHLELIKIIKTNKMLEPVRMFLSTEGESVQNIFIFDALAIFNQYDLFTITITEEHARKLYEMVAKIIRRKDKEREILTYTDYLLSIE